MASLNISLSDLPESQGYDLIPDGWYRAKIKGAELRAVKAKTGETYRHQGGQESMVVDVTRETGGQYISVQYSIEGPTHSGRVVFGNLNIKNRNPEAERIGLQQLGEVMGAIGLAKIQDTDQLIGGDLMIKVGTSKKQEGFEQRNEVKGFKAIEGGAPPMPTQSPPATGAPKAPWQK